jgi:hypothetical protein
MVKFWASTTSNLDLLETQIFEFVVLHKVKAFRMEKVLRKLVYFFLLNAIATFYNLHFANYSLGKKQVIQFTLVVVWKQVYIDYQATYLDSYLVEETFKD